MELALAGTCSENNNGLCRVKAGSLGWGLGAAAAVILT